jgi:hypothetical protein
MNDDDLKAMIAPRKECGKEFEMRIPIKFQDAVVAACEDESEKPTFTDRCPDCRANDPFRPEPSEGSGHHDHRRSLAD